MHVHVGGGVGHGVGWPPPGGMITFENEPPWQPEFEKPAAAPDTPHTLTGALTGRFKVLPEPAEMTPALPLPPPEPPPLSITVLLAAPPPQPAFAPPSRDTAMPQTSTGKLTGAFTSLPDRTDSTPLSPFGPESAKAALDGNANPATSTAAPAAAETQRALFIWLLHFGPAVAHATAGYL